MRPSIVELKPRINFTLTHPAASLYPLVNIVREGLAGHITSRSLSGVEGPFLQYNLSLADDHQGRPAHLHPLKDVVLYCLEDHKGIDTVNQMALSFLMVIKRDVITRKVCSPSGRVLLNCSIITSTLKHHIPNVQIIIDLQAVI